MMTDDPDDIPDLIPSSPDIAKVPVTVITGKVTYELFQLLILRNHHLWAMNVKWFKLCIDGNWQSK